jgi:predicted transcriptional regulator of viral defense system
MMYSKGMDMKPVKTATRLAKQFAVLRARDFERHGLSRQHLPAVVAQGVWEKGARGVYLSTLRPPTAQHSLLETMVRRPQAVLCLLSALRFHELTTQTPAEIWLALPRNSRAPRFDSVDTRIVRVSEPAFSAGIEEHRIDGVPVRVYSKAKTVVDCFKFRNQIGLDVALEALRDAWRSRKVTADDLWRFAKICRVAKVMRPYLESVVS